MSGFTRRDFLRLAMVGAGVTLTTWPWRPAEGAQESDPPDLVIARGSSPAQITETALEALGGIDRFISRGDVVLIKPNMSWDRSPELAANTNPELVATLVRSCLGAGAKEVKIFDNTCEDARRTYVRSGVMEAAKKAGGKVAYMDERRFRETEIKGEVLQKWEVYQEAMEVDKMINVPILKHHSLARLTMGMKNLMGLIGGSRARLHWNLDPALVDLAAFFKPTLVVLDAVRILTRSGPQGGSVKYVKRGNTVAAGIDQVAIEALGAQLFGVSPEEMDHIKLAHERGLGQMDLAKVSVKEVKTDFSG